MSLALLSLVATALIGAAFLAGRGRARLTQGGERLHSLPEYYGWYAAICAGIPALACVGLWLLITPLIIEPLVPGRIPAGAIGEQPDLFLNDVRNLLNAATPMAASEATREAADLYGRYQNGAFFLAVVAAVALGSAGMGLGLRRIQPRFPARIAVESSVQGVLLLCSTVAVLITAGIVFSLLFETLRFFDRVSPIEFLFGLHWSPQTALRADQVGSSGSFGAIPLFAGTLLVTGIAIAVAAPVGLLSAIYMTFYASPRIRRMLKPALEMLAGVPTVVYGFFAALIIAPTIRQWGSVIGLDIASESALAAGLVMGVMIIPFISSLSDDAIVAVPSALRDGSYGLGATRSETIRQVIIPAALPGIVGAFLLAISRAIGETMIVVMAAGLAANLTANPLAAVTTVTVQIVTLLTGDQEFDSAKTLAAFALGLALFAITLLLNAFALRIVHKYRERYD